METILFAVVVGVVAFAMARFGKTGMEGALRNPKRRWLAWLVSRRPGLGVHAISQEAKIARGTVEWHLAVLEACGEVYELREGRSRRYFSSSTEREEADCIVLLRRGRVLDVVELTVDRPGRTQAELLLDLGMRRNVIRRYADLLVERSLLDERRDGAKRRYFPTPRLMRVLPLLHESSEECLPPPMDPPEAPRP